MQAELQQPEAIRGGVVAAPPLPAAAPRSWLEGGLALLNPSGRILEINEPFSSWLEKTRADLLGQSFWETLAALSAEWKPALDRMGRRDSAFDHLELRLFSSADRPAQWFQLDLARGPETWFARLDSALPPLTELEEAAWDEHLHNSAARREMFIESPFL